MVSSSGQKKIHRYKPTDFFPQKQRLLRGYSRIGAAQTHRPDLSTKNPDRNEKSNPTA
jgi:hypothetical protein